jgi:hypothetical protein
MRLNVIRSAKTDCRSDLNVVAQAASATAMIC